MSFFLHAKCRLKQIHIIDLSWARFDNRRLNQMASEIILDLCIHLIDFLLEEDIFVVVALMEVESRGKYCQFSRVESRGCGAVGACCYVFHIE